mmetsp:Transcript_2898/g.3404  ORF Transcript_2898/g.3404 Transcript_2898/m.3404 type:complete len:474 (+) Transcript_2898:117-1538(+)
MRKTTILAASKVGRSMRSLALNVHFKHPELGMKDYEILSRASAFLVSVDPPNQEETSKYSHITDSNRERESLLHKQNYAYDPAGGKPREAKDLNWLEFCPGKFRPLTHVLASSHVLSPWLWKKYYPQPWLDIVTQDHVRYSLGVYDNSSEGDMRREPLAVFALNPYPIHHPGEMDLAVVHLKQEETALKHMTNLGIEMLHLTDNDKIFDQGDEVFFDGFEIAEEHYSQMERLDEELQNKRNKESSEEDTRVFFPYTESGNLIFASTTRFLASTNRPLPEGLCGGPVLDGDNTVCGIVEGLVPIDHENKKMAGAASFIPYFRLKEFIDYAEKHMLEQILPKKLFDKVVDLKDGKPLNHNQGTLNLGQDSDTSGDEKGGYNMDGAYASMVESMKKAHTSEQVEAIMGTIEREQKEVLEILEKEGGDLDEVVAQVRAKTRQRQREILEELAGQSDIKEAEIVSECQTDDDESHKTI